MATITGAKGGGQKQHTPVEQPDSAQSMARCRMLLALGEGEFAGGLDATRIFLDGTPLGNADGTMNFEGVSWDFRPGTQTQTPIPGFPAVENEISIGVSLTKATPWTRAISNTQLDAVLVRVGIPQLQKQEKDADIVGTTVKYHIDLAIDGGAFSTIMTKTVTEKLSALYELTHRINLPKANTGWQIRVVRDTADSTSQLLQNKTQVQAITEVIDARLRYPHTALLYVSFNAKSFSNIPKISCKPKGRIIRIPQNYDPVARSYSGTWNGTFKWGWTNNPAWIWFDVLTEPRFGLGRRVTVDMLDKWELYRIAQRCDQKVPDGKGGNGNEPRFMFDVYIQSEADAWQVIKDIAAGFNGMTFWGNNMFNVVSDMPADMSKLQILTRASVVGKPVYSSGSEKNRFSSALVNFSDPDNHYQDRTTAVMFPELVKQFKFKQTQLTAIGCTRESEAQRRGGWAVYSNFLDRIITLQTGLDGVVYVPGTVFAFADERVSGRIYGGRITEYNSAIKAVTTDRGTSAVAGDSLLIRTQGGTVESRVIQAVNGTQLIVSTPFKAAPLPNAIFVIDAGQLRLQYFRVTNLTFNDEENTFTITGTEYNASKYDAVDNNARLDTPPISLIPTGLVAQPQNVVITSYDSVRQGQRIATLVASWDPPLDKNGKPQADIVSYRVQWKRGENEWINVPATGLRNIEVPGIFEGDYLVRVCAINSGGASSLWASSTLTHLSGRIGAVPKPVGLIATPINWGIQLNWAFPAGSEDTLQTEVQYSASSTGNNPMLLAGVPYPQHSYTQAGLRAGQEFWYRARLVDRIGNQSDWTDWVRGMSNDQASDYLDAIKDQVLLAADGKALTEKIDFSIAGILQGTLADIQGAKVSFEQFGIARAEISQAQELIADADKAYAEFKDLVAVRFGDSAAEILTVKKAQATTDSALASLTTTVQATTENVDALTGRITKAEASVVSISEAQTSTDKALATLEQQTTATFDKQQSAINQKFTSYADATSANAIYTLKAGVKYNGNYYDAGLSVAVLVNNGQVSTRVAINANELVVLSGSSTSQMYSPFAIINGQVFLNDAFIQNGTITSAKIADAAITNAKIANASITNAKISGDLWSANFVSGMFGWIVRQDGSAEFNNVLIRGTVEADEFIGDVANGQVFPDTGISSTANVAFTYTDSGTKSRAKHVVLMAMVSVGGATGPGTDGGAADVTMRIGNVSKTYRVKTVSGQGRVYTTLMVSALITARSVACSISANTGGESSGGTCQILSPSVIVARGSGAFEQTT
ncbi:host specificity protein J [Phytobacter sp. AG2a]